MITFERANKAIEAMVQHALEQYHPELHKMGVTIDVMVAHQQDKDEMDCHALKRSGYPIDAKIQVTSLVDRARGIADAKLTIDAFEWNRMSDKSKAALIDHELTHLLLVEIKPTKKNGFETGWKRDDLTRPKLRNRPHDYELAGYREVIERHGQHSHEAQQFAAFRDEYGQLNMFGPSAIQIADGTAKNGKKDKTIEKTKVLHTFDDGKSTISSTIDLSRACAARHHNRCKYDGCQCDCGHPKKENRANA